MLLSTQWLIRSSIYIVLTTDGDSCIAVEKFGNYLFLILASEVPFAPFMSAPSYKGFLAFVGQISYRPS